MIITYIIIVLISCLGVEGCACHCVDANLIKAVSTRSDIVKIFNGVECKNYNYNLTCTYNSNYFNIVKMESISQSAIFTIENDYVINKVFSEQITDYHLLPQFKLAPEFSVFE